MRPRLQRALGAMVFVLALVSAWMTWRAMATRGPDQVTALEAEFRILARFAPASGAIGYLEHYEHADNADNVLVYYVAQYAFVPRLVVPRTDLEFLLVARDAARPGWDARLVDFVPVAGTSSGHRLYRRRVR